MYVVIITISTDWYLISAMCRLLTAPVPTTDHNNIIIIIIISNDAHALRCFILLYDKYKIEILFFEIFYLNSQTILVQ